MIPTPDLSHLTKEDYESVYEPAGTGLLCYVINEELHDSHEMCVVLTEDTFILLDALEEDSQELQGMKPQICLEIGQVKYDPHTLPSVDASVFVVLAQDACPPSLEQFWVPPRPVHVQSTFSAH